MPEYTTGGGHVITPVVGLVPQGLQFRLNEAEVAEVFQIPLDFLMDPGNHQRRVHVGSDGVERPFLAMPWTRPDDGREFFVWGITAAMVRNLYRYLADD